MQCIALRGVGVEGSAGDLGMVPNSATNMLFGLKQDIPHFSFPIYNMRHLDWMVVKVSPSSDILCSSSS